MKNMKITLAIMLLVLILVISGCVPVEKTETEQSAAEIESSIADIDKDLEDLNLSELEELDKELAEIERLT